MPEKITPQSDKISKFLDAIHKEAEQRREKITAETENFKKAELQKAENEALNEAYKLIQSEIIEARAEISRATASHELEMKRRLLQHRNDLTDKVFDKARQELTAFAATDEYKSAVLGYMDKAVKIFGDEPVTVFLREADITLKGALLSKCSPGSTVETCREINLGGIKVISASGKIIADFTYETCLENEREHFYSESGLKI